MSIKDKLAETEGPDMKEQMQDQIRQWFIEVRCEILIIIHKTVCGVHMYDICDLTVYKKGASMWVS